MSRAEAAKLATANAANVSVEDEPDEDRNVQNLHLAGSDKLPKNDAERLFGPNGR